MPRWEIVDREYHNPEWDLLTVHIHYKSATARNQYLIKKDERRVPRECLEERKWGNTTHLDGRNWIEGSLRRKPKRVSKPQPKDYAKMTHRRRRMLRDEGGEA